MIRFWYLLTPVFILLDWLWGINWRVAGLDESTARAAYYVFCLACAGLVILKAGPAAQVALVESSVNFGILMVSVVSSMFYAPADVAAGNPVWIMTPARLINFLLVGVILIVSINRSIRALKYPQA